MNCFVFLAKDSDYYDIGILKVEDKVSQMVVSMNESAISIRYIINQLPEGCQFIGNNLRFGTLKPLLQELCIAKLDLPEQLKFHWVPPYKVPIEDIQWIYNFGMYSNEEPASIEEMLSNLGLSSTQNIIRDITNIYFTLIGDFDRLI
jgi:hypothetical protein